MRRFRLALSAFALVVSAALAAAALATAPAFAADQDDVLAHVQKFVAAFNAGDAKAAQECCLDDMSIIDEFPPYEWHGPGTLGKWLADYAADAKKNGITDGKVTTAKAKHVFVDGGRAYVVAPSDYEYKKNGKPVKQKGSAFVFALVKQEGAWKVTGWSWGQN